MLITLRIRNLALVADLTLDLDPGCNAITGETGAGKSILIGGLNLVLGERADRTLIRSGADSCSVEAVFDVSRVSSALTKMLEEHGVEPCHESQLLLKRSFSAGGTNRQFVNGSPVTLPVLAAIGEWLVDIHGPHEHQSLLHPSKQLAILDAFGGLDDARAEFASFLERFNALERRKRELIVDERTYAQQLDLLRFQTGEIASAGFKPGDEEQLERDHRRASNASRILELGQAAQDALSESETAVLSQARTLGRALHELDKLDPGFAKIIETFTQALEMLKDVQDQLSRHLGKVDVDPAVLASLEERINLFGSLKRKYGGTIEEILAFGANAAEKLHALEQRDTEIAAINSDLGLLRKELWTRAKALSQKREKVIPKLRKEVCKQLEDLGFAQSRFDVPLTTVPDSACDDPKFAFQSSGIDSAEFMFAPNPGEAARPLRAIASSGELARVMLALKTVLAGQDQVPVLIFDEVDANVGGQTARAIGEKMRQISRERQVICITHSAHVAAPASAHFLVSKHVRDGRTVSEVVRLKEQQRVTELARMLGGPVEAALRHAEALLK